MHAGGVIGLDTVADGSSPIAGQERYRAITSA
jgi:hypothetical protein